ncbi:hypothetical protein GLOTRDRAFT_126346 [Gloeophyllum trabeum ATCC 11539]|uniref:Uncharacterized protein n=1 Tax=Gloeophyllum trabeum (strain ATCC 11539 / FP-39264 / Madison 617) TaxID=670483 RepID=S7RWX1_GLOTA|nr:uncharacterized protein GLOTRDRAFT_126346 [Gloeophyllum trabeum ATCC 11539]EPQ57854.1 hypothetical protein GLOTRDRAFT_126346 [Gloeophyllum trabeum ATCC 11539]
MASPLSTSSNRSKLSLPDSDHSSTVIMLTPRTDALPAPRRWQTQPVPRSHHVLGYLITKAMTRRFYDNCSRGSTNLESVLVYVDKDRMKMGEVLVLADNRGRLPKHRVPPPPDAVDKIADDLGLEGDAREPIWYKCVD